MTEVIKFRNEQGKTAEIRNERISSGGRILTKVINGKKVDTNFARAPKQAERCENEWIGELMKLGYLPMSVATKLWK